MNRQRIRRDLFRKHFEVLDGKMPRIDRPTRPERRKLARAYAAGEWRKHLSQQAIADTPAAP